MTKSQAQFVQELIKRGIEHGKDEKDKQIINIFKKADKEFKKATGPGGKCPVK